MNRRSFLRRVGSTSAALGATALIGSAEACSTGRSPNASPTTTTGPTTTGPTTSGGGTSTGTGPGIGPANWSVLASTLTGSLVMPGDATYASSVELYNELFTPGPAAVAYCANPTDVQRCVAYARKHDVPVAARSGGHSYGGYSSSRGLVIDVSALNDIAVGAGSTQAVVGAGAQLINVYSQLGSAGVLVPGGSCPTVGIAGLALGGGIGVFGRAYGMTCDNISSLNVVTADGSLRQCSSTQNSDLYWASQGGGGGNFGVVTSFTFKVHPIPAVTLFTLEWPWAEAGTVLDAWLSWMPTTPSELWSNCQLFSNGSAGGGSLKVTGVFAGTTAACTSALAPLLSAVGAAPSYRFVGPEDYLRAMMIEAGCEGKTVAQCNLPSRSPAGTLGRSAFSAKSSFVDAPFSTAGTTAMIDAVEALGSEVPQVGGGIVFDGYGGVINQVAAGDTAFVHRSAIACAQYSVTYASGAPGSSVIAAAHSWLEQTQSTFAPFAKGAYQNYIDATLPNWGQAYYGSNLPRLMRVKRRYDPDDFFHFAQSIPVAT
ncbi:MAG TPA: FAD-dependent oxidoreductase [Acidimicrobiales bacterium]|jgi:hypothetical protein|nr:FAD-dependent oxidoreductase [Acidimicrobiales bacterium]